LSISINIVLACESD